MTRVTLSAVTVFSMLIAGTQSASAQDDAQSVPMPEDKPGEGDKPAPEPEPDPFSPEGSDDPDGTAENPNAPTLPFDEQPAKVVKKAKVRAAGYPIESVYRPIVLPEFTAEIVLDYRTNPSPFRGDGLIGGRFGITDKAQIGLRYGFGSATEDGYKEGRVAAIDFEYLIKDWVSAQLAVPILFNPFAVGVTLGAPMKWTFVGDKLAFETGRDLISFRTNKFVPEIQNAAATAALIAADEVGTDLDEGSIFLSGSLTYQYKPNIALQGRMGWRINDFQTASDNPIPLDVGAVYSTSNKYDFGGRIGFDDLGVGVDTFGVTVFAAARIL